MNAATGQEKIRLPGQAPGTPGALPRREGQPPAVADLARITCARHTASLTSFCVDKPAVYLARSRRRQGDAKSKRPPLIASDWAGRITASCRLESTSARVGLRLGLATSLECISCWIESGRRRWLSGVAALPDRAFEKSRKESACGLPTWQHDRRRRAATRPARWSPPQT